MAEATQLACMARAQRNTRPQLSEHEAAVALVTLLNAAAQVLTIGQQRSVLTRACRVRIISIKRGRAHE